MNPGVAGQIEWLRFKLKFKCDEVAQLNLQLRA